MDKLNEYAERYGEVFLSYLPNIITSIIILIAGLWAIKIIKNLLKRAFGKSEMEETLKTFLLNVIGWTLKILLFVIVISQMGVETTSLVAIVGAAGGVLIMIFKPFKLGDFIEAQGESGTVKEIAIFYTKLLTINNQLVVLPNGKLSNDNIKNYTSEGKRRDVLTFGISYDSDIKLAREILVKLMKEQENILEDPEPVVFVAELADSSVNLSARFWALNEHFWNCHFYTIEEAKTRLEAAGIIIPFPQRDVHHFNLEKLQNK